SALSTELRACAMEPPAGVEPAPRPYKGRVLAVDTTEAEVETAGLEPAPPRCKRGALVPLSYVPKVRTGGVEPPQRFGGGVTGRGAHPCSASARGVTGRTRTGTAGITTPDARRYTTVTLGGDDRTR